MGKDGGDSARTTSYQQAVGDSAPGLDAEAEKAGEGLPSPAAPVAEKKPLLNESRDKAASAVSPPPKSPTKKGKEKQTRAEKLDELKRELKIDDHMIPIEEVRDNSLWLSIPQSLPSTVAVSRRLSWF